MPISLVPLTLCGCEKKLNEQDNKLRDELKIVREIMEKQLKKIEKLERINDFLKHENEKLRGDN